MKSLDLNQMEHCTGGGRPSADCLGFAVGAAAVFTFATIATGGAVLPFAMAAIGSMGAGAFC